MDIGQVDLTVVNVAVFLRTGVETKQTVWTEWTGRPDSGERGRVSEDRSRD